MASILDLPVELVLDIIQDFGRDDLCASRQTCKQLNEYSMDKFGRVCFTTINLVPTLEPLERLQKLANHPKLKGFVREVKIITGYLTYIAHDRDAEHYNKRVPNEALPYLQTHSGWQHYANESAKFVSSGNIGALLAPAFADFDAIQVSLEWKREFSCKGVWGALSFQGEDIDWWWTCPNWDYEGPNIHSIVCSEVLEACYKTNPHSLRFNGILPKWIRAMERPASYLFDALSSLKTLHIELVNIGRIQSCATTETLLVRFLNSVPNLEDLKLDFRSWSHDLDAGGLVRKVFLRVRFVSLERLSLHNFCARAADLSLFLSRCKLTLVSLDFRHANLDSRIFCYDDPTSMIEYEPNVRSWIGVLEQLEDSASLKSLGIEALYPVYVWMALREIKELGKYSLKTFVNILKDSRSWPLELTGDPDTQAEDYTAYDRSLSVYVQRSLRRHKHCSSKAQVNLIIKPHLFSALTFLQARLNIEGSAWVK